MFPGTAENNSLQTASKKKKIEAVQGDCKNSSFHNLRYLSGLLKQSF